jgi:formylglycine-generating enzyme required for sulfatase activity
MNCGGRLRLSNQDSIPQANEGLNCNQQRRRTPLEKGPMRTRFRVSLVCALILSAFAAVGVEGPVDDFFINSVSGMAPEQQVHAVDTQLKKLNPNFDGKDTHKIENGVVTELSFSTVRVTDISPLKALKWLKKLVIAPSMLNQKGALADLAPLKGLPLTWLWCHNNPINDLTPLRGMPLTILSFNGTQVSDLSPLNGMKLTSLSFSDTLVADLAPLENMPLSLLWCNNTKVTDLSPLRAMPLQELKCDFVADRDAAILRDIKSLARINDMPAAAFWKRVGPVMVRVSPSVPSIATQTPSPSQGTVPTILSPAATTKLSPAATAKAQTGQPFVSSIGMELLYIPPGEFLMGSTKGEQAWAAQNGSSENVVRQEGEQPRKTMIKEGFWLGRTEVTVGQWKAFVMATGYKTDAEKKGYADHALQIGRPWGRVDGLSWRDPGFGSAPQDRDAVSCISWNDAVAFCEWLTEQERKAGRLALGQVVRLPTEAEWEYACRAGRQTKFWWGESQEDSKGRLNWSGKDDGFEFLAPVDSYGERGRNGFGLADMLGNVYEWCLDEFDEKQAHEECYKGNSGMRVLRGGSFLYGPAVDRCAFRHANPPDRSVSFYGFRVAVGVDVGATKPTTAQSAGQGDSLEIVSISPPLPAVFKIDDRGFAESVNVTIRYRLDSSDAGRIWAQATTKAKYSYTPSTVIEKGSGEIVRGFFLREPGIVEAVRVIMLDDRTKTQIKSVSLPIRAEWRMKN